MAEKKNKKEPKVNFESLPEDIGKLDEKQHIDQIGPAVTDVYIKHAKYTDKNGVVRFKTKFNKKEGGALADDTFDALGYHTHRRRFGIDEKIYNSLKKFKDANGNPYVDAVTQRDFPGLSREGLNRALAGDDENKISHKTLENMLEKSVENHKELLLKGYIDKKGLDKVENRESVISAIEGIVDKYHLNKNIKKDLKTKSGDELAVTYIQLADQSYKREKA